MLARLKEEEGRPQRVAETIFFVAVWIIGLIAALYLIYNALYLLGLAAIFGFNAPPTPVLGYLAFVAKNAIPAICFTALGVTGLLFWLSKRFWPLGLSAIVIETALAIYDIADPNKLLILNMLPK